MENGPGFVKDWCVNGMKIDFMKTRQKLKTHKCDTITVNAN